VNPERRRRRHLLIPITAVALLAAGCSGSPSPESAPSVSPTPSSGTPSSSPPGDTTSRPPSGPPTSSTPGTPSGKPTWTKILRQPVDGQHIVTQPRK
jgi:hypothetical protein